MIVAYVAAAGSMAAKDALNTFLVIAEARGRAVLAGVFDAAGDIATILCTIVGAGAVITQGWDAHTVGILAVMLVTSFFGTILWTIIGRRMKTQPDRAVPAPLFFTQPPPRTVARPTPKEKK